MKHAAEVEVPVEGSRPAECEILEQAGVKLVWFDSMGAKSSSILIGRVLVDPGAAAMQPSYPLPAEEKRELRRRAVKAIIDAAEAAEALVVTHYHYDHHLRVYDGDLPEPGLPYRKARLIVAKNPNTYINESQWKRARELLRDLLRLYGLDLNSYLAEPGKIDFNDPVNTLSEALSRSFGDYDARRRELLRKGRQWFNNLKKLWASGPWVRETIEIPNGPKIVLTDSGFFEVSGVRFNLLGPHFHGVEYDRTGWVVPVLAESRGLRILYTSDLMGPIIEDYAYEIVRLRPNILILDGPPTYLYPYMFNRVNLERAVSNAVRILEETASLKLVIYDHHLLREKKWRERVSKVFETSRRTGIPVLTASECLGRKPVIDLL